MKTIKYSIIPILSAIALGVLGWVLVKSQSATRPSEVAHHEAVLQHGEYLIKLGGCADCHTPKVMTDLGPADDPNRRFAGHPADLVLPPPSLDPANPWGAATAGMTAWTGPWGVTFSANLTPDRETGIGAWTQEDFIRTFRTGKHKGSGRAILPPMPWQPLADAKEEDLEAMYHYLMSVPAVKNQVPAPLPPATAAR
ncbi:diheme cytochrome c-553 [Haloferula sargassicola]|uniref:Cytochrome c domain-containing protein n=1 Tax=Haloferula sargassicola TaxID=490096 RepID=A0ABP9UIC8_9BACT